MQIPLPSSHIVSDGWTAYGNISMLNHGIYTRSVVIHRDNFVDQYDAEAHTQNVENKWMCGALYIE